MDLQEAKKTLIEILKPASDTEKAVFEAIITTAWQSGYECAQGITLKGLDQLDQILKN